MTDLPETSIIVVDDDPKHGFAVVQALSHEGLGVAYFTGAIEELPRIALTGVRLAVLDMDLAEGDVAGREPKERLAPLLSVLGRLVGRTNGPYVATVWTSHPELVADFKTEFVRLNPTAPPMFVTQLDKAEFYRGDDLDSGRLQTKLIESVEQAWPLNLLIGWESYSRRASSEVVTLLSQPVVDDASQATTPATEFDARLDMWAKRLTAILRALTVAMSSETGSKDRAAFAVYTGLNEIQRDQLEKLASRADAGTIAQGARLFDQGAATHTRRDTAIMNGALLFSSPPPSDPVPWPGDVFRYSEVFPTPAQAPVTFTAEQILKDIFEPDKMALKQTGQPSLPWHHLPRVEAECTLVMTEVTPVCDYVQGKHFFSTFVCGILVPEAHQDKIKRSNAQYLWKTPFFSIQASGSGGQTDLLLVLDFQFTFSTKKVAIGAVRPLFRLRETVLHDIQAGRGRHVSRPGFVFVEPP